MQDDRDDNYFDDPQIENYHQSHSVDPDSYSGFLYSFFVLGRLLLGLLLILGIPFLTFSFSDSISGYMKVLGLFLIFHVICRIFGWKLS